ncbi:MAG: efflux RND transporter permease subunit [Spirochaetales bacterium]|nr:efflux RND transporter permease subunit [Spirochaetales bacterium]
MDITRYTLTNKTVTIVAVIILMLGGLFAYFTLPQTEDPGFTIRIAQVITVYPGASPERVRDLVTEPLENSINEMSEVEVLSSISKQGISNISVQISFKYSDLDKIWAELSDRVGEVKDDLPDGIKGPRVEDDFGDVFSILMTITGEGYSVEELDGIAKEVRREILQLSDVGRVEIYGIPDREVEVAYDRARLKNLGLTPYSISNSIQRTNVVRPAGSLSISPEEIIVESSGNFPSLDALGETLITAPETGHLIPLRDITRISLQSETPLDSIVRFNGDQAAVLAINMKDDGQITVLGDKVQALAEDLEVRYPLGVEFDFVAFQPEIVSNLVDDFTSNVIMAILVVIAVMVISSGLRSGLVVAALIPTSMIGSLLIMNLLGLSINQMSLAALIIVLGMLVDSAIVFVESMTLELEKGLLPDEAALKVSRELRIPLLTSALTTAAAFLPIALAQNNAGEYTRPLFYVVTITLLLSWILTITFIPLLSAKLLPSYVERRKKKARESGKKVETIDTGLHRWYAGVLASLLRHRFATLWAMVTLLFGALILFTQLPSSFFPDTNYPIFTMDIALPTGTGIDETTQLADEIELFLDSELGDMIEFHGAFIGGGVPRYRLNINPQDSRPEYVFFLARATSLEALDEIFPKVRSYITDLAPDASIQLKPFSFGPGSNAPVEIRMSGSDRKKLYENVALVKARLGEIDGVTNIRDNWGIRNKTINVTVREASARRFGVTHRDVATSLQAASVGLEISEFRGEDESIPILLRDSGVRRTSIEDLESTAVYSETSGLTVPLRQVADIDLLWQPSVIVMRDQTETITVQADTLGDMNPIDVAAMLEPWLDEQEGQWPIGFQYEFGGEVEGSGEANRAIIAQLPLVLFIITLLLVTQFNSLRLPFIILVTIPFGFIGVVFGLWVMGNSFSFMALLGLVSLSGVVLNDAIVLLEKIKQGQDDGKPAITAIFYASLRKMRPIILTSVTTITGLIPLLLFGGPLWQPMASALMFGLAFATILTLGLIPVLYSLLFRTGRAEEVPSMEEILQ